MRNKRLAYIGVAIVATLVIVLLIVPSFIDWSKYQQLAKDKVAAATGYDLTVGGAFRAGFLPRPHLSAENVILRKPSAASGDTFVTLDDVNVTLAFWPLLIGHVNVSSITLDTPVVTMVTYKDGTNNWSPKAQDATTAADATASGQPGDKKTAAPAVSVGSFHVKGGHITMRDEARNTTQDIAIDDLTLKADSMAGPFEGDGTIGYNKAKFDIDFSTGGYAAGQSMPVQFEAKDDSGRADVKFNGVVAMQPTWEAQGESDMSFKDIGGVLNDAGIAASVPNLGGDTSLSGMLTVNATHILLTNGEAHVGGTKMAATLDWKKTTGGAQTIKAALSTRDAINLDEVLKVAEKVSKDSSTPSKDDDAKPSKDQSPSDAVKVMPLLPAKISLPAGLTGDIEIRAGSLKYKGQETGELALLTSLSNGSATTHLTLATLPGDGDLAISADLKAAKPLADGASYNGTLIDPVIEGKILGSSGSLKILLSDWLKVVDAKTFDVPGMPKHVDADIDYRISGYNATATLNTLSFGETKLDGSTVLYTAAKRPIVNAKLTANVITLPAAAGSQPAKADTASDAKKADDGKKIDLEKTLDFNPPQLPFDLKFNVALARFVQGDLLLTDISAAGVYDSTGLSLTSAQATTKGGTLSAAGRVADLKALSGIDMQAGLRTDDLESFYTAMTGNKLALEQPIGAFTGSIRAKGDKSKLDTTLNAQARGYTVDASGVLDHPFEPDLPGTLNVRVRHADFVQAVRAFSPGFGSGTGSPIDLSGQVSINGKVYDIKDLKGSLGASDVAGTLHADLSGAKPSFKADLTSKTLALGDFVGVKSQTPSASTSDVAVAAAAMGSGRTDTHWSREPMDTGFLKAANFDIAVKAGTLTYGSWVLSDADLSAKMADGSLKAPISAKMYGGTLSGNLDASSAGEDAPLNVAFTANGKDVNIGSFLSALTASSKKKADGTGSIAVDVKGAGTSAATLVSSLAGKIDISTRTLAIYGIDLDKLAANTVEAFDGGWKGVLAGVTTQGFAGGNTDFKDVDQSFALTNGNMPVKDFKMVTTSGNATMISNGFVNFANWNMDLSNQVQVTQPKDTPVIGLRLFGPLDTPQKSINSAALDNLLQGKIGDKLQGIVDDKLGKDSKAGAILDNLLGNKKTAAPAPSTTPTPATEAAPAATPEAPKKKESKQEKALGILNQLIAPQQ